jgi:hypothetical protein
VPNEPADALADHWLGLMSDIGWEQAAVSIRKRHPRACGESTQITEQGIPFDVSDSWTWANEPEGDIILIVEVYACDGSNEPLAVRSRTIIRPGLN